MQQPQNTDGAVVLAPVPAVEEGTEPPLAIVAARRLPALARLLPRILGFGLVASVLLVGLATPGFFTMTNIIDIVQAASSAGIAALGLTFVTISGNYFTLSLEQTVACGAVTFALSVSHGLGVPLSFVITLAVAAATGAIQGAVVAFGANPIIVTLGAGAALYGILLNITGGQNVYMVPNPAAAIGTGRVFNLPYIALIFVGLCIVAELVLRYTRYGRSVCLVGANKASARRAGLRTKWIIGGTFVLCAITSGIVGILSAAQFGEAGAEQFSGFTFTVVAAVLISGISLKGGSGSMLRSGLGACVIAMLINVCVLRGYSYGAQLLIEGIAIMMGICIYHLARVAKEGS
jgi:ribose transport system permease protein